MSTHEWMGSDMGNPSSSLPAENTSSAKPRPCFPGMDLIIHRPENDRSSSHLQESITMKMPTTLFNSTPLALTLAPMHRLSYTSLQVLPYPRGHAMAILKLVHSQK